MYFVLNFNPYCIFYYIFLIVVGKKNDICSSAYSCPHIKHVILSRVSQQTNISPKMAVRKFPHSLILNSPWIFGM